MDAAESASELAETFYPEDSELEDDANHRQTREAADRVNEVVHDEKHDPPFTLEELRVAVDGFNPKKAPGEDGLTADICKQAIAQCPDVYLALANKCLELGYFPTTWKQATIIVLRKPGKEDYSNPKSYRPIGLLPVMGKILEKMIVCRIKWHLLPRMSTRQYGFMPQRGTEDSLYDLIHHIKNKINEKKLVTMVSLDIEGAFDNAWWPAIRIRLAEEKCPVNIRRVIDSYLQGRAVCLRYAGVEHRKSTAKGCVQGSIGGPIFWNLLLDPLLKELENRGDYVQAFADDVVLVFHGDTGQEVQRHANAALACVREWGIRNKLKFAPHKTKAMTLTRKLKYDTPLLSMGGVGIGMSKEIKILGLTIDSKLTFNKHVANVCKKALNIYKQLARAARVSWGLHPEIIRIIYLATVEPVILYAAGAWAPAVRKLGIQKHLNAVQRGFALKLCKAYRTVSLHSSLVLAGLLPLDLRVREAAALYEAKRGVPRPSLGGREVEKMVPYASTPHPAVNVGPGFACLKDQEEVNRNNDQTVRIYTDGSKIEGKVGAALSLWNNETETKTFKFKLSSCCSVYQAELLAIVRATKQVLQRPEESYGIYSDSRSALEAIRNMSPHPLAAEARENLRAIQLQHKQVTLFWLKAHVGIEGNERADVLAKDAALKLKTKPDYDLVPVSYVKRQIRMESLDEWNRRYRSGETASVTKLFLPDAVDAYRVVKKFVPNRFTTQMMTGHGGFSEYLNRFKCKENPSCICEAGVLETVPHILFDCPVFGRERHDLENEIDLKLNKEGVSKIMLKNESREIFLKFCEKLVIKVNKRNR